MSFTSFYFFCLVAATVILYYIFPVKVRWIVPLVSSCTFIWFANESVKLILIMGVSALVAYLTGLFVDKAKSNGKTGKLFVTVGVVLIAVCMLSLKDSNFFINLYNKVSPNDIPLLSLAAPLGISYYSLTWIGYMLDVYWGTCEVEKNPVKFLAFATYFPLLTSGPIVKFQEVGKEITTGHKFDYDHVCFGLQRMVWGLMKKLCISERLAVIVNTIYGDTETYQGLYIYIAMICFVVQLYTDFSGCVDIALGVAEMLGVALPENFDLPFLSRNISEFWRRWHITLGGWLRDYILYPILKSTPWQKMGKATKKTFGKKWGKKIPTWCGLFISWFLIGFWHGGAWNYIIGVGLLFWAIIVVSEMLEKPVTFVVDKIGFNRDCFSYHAFQVIRTFILFTIGLSMFRCYNGLGQVKEVWKAAFAINNPWIFFDDSLYALGLDVKDMHVLWFFMLVLILSGFIRYYTKKSIRQLVAEQNIVFRWILYLALFFAVIIYGCYGSGYDAADFIYQQF